MDSDTPNIDHPRDALFQVAYIGNFEPTYSTENEYAHAFEQNDCAVHRIQEGDATQLALLCDQLLQRRGPDFILWTRTKSLSDRIDDVTWWKMARLAGRSGVPVVGVHLDRWWGLGRQQDLFATPYFRAVDIMFTADGGHDHLWERTGINHSWLPPGISERWCNLGVAKPQYDCDVVFVGGWRNYGHPEWKHRHELIAKLSTWYGDRFLALPRPFADAIRGLELNDVYVSAKVVVGDSCLVPKADGSPMTHYCSDRIPETLGRGGILFHPAVEGVNARADDPFGFSATWPLGDWAALKRSIDASIESDFGWREALRPEYVERVSQEHTYTVRARQILDELAARGMILG
jgi:hypothetical protein